MLTGGLGLRRAALLATALGALIAAAPAAAATRYAAPDGSGPFASCPQSDPCDLQTAVEAAAVQPGDVVVVLPGTYLTEGDQLSVSQGIVVRGKSGDARPRILSSASPAGMGVYSDDAIVRRLDIDYTGSSSALVLQGGTAERVAVDSVGASACQTLGGTIRDSICWSHGNTFAGHAVSAAASGGGPFTLLLRNVTAVASGANGYGLDAQAGPSTIVSIDAKSVIAQGIDADARAFTGTGGTATVTLDHSDYATESEQGVAGASVTDPGSGTNQTDEPLFVDIGAGDFRQYLGSPTINAGELDNFSGSLDVEDEPRTMGPTPDMGADEFDPTPPQTRISDHPRRRTAKRRARFKFRSNHPTSTFECKLDAAPYEDCRSPRTFTGLTRGRHVFKVRATDELGKVDPKPARFAWKVVAG